MKSNSVFFYEDNDLVYCTDIAQLLHKLQVPQYQPEDWRLFIDSSKRSLQCILLPNGNQFSSVPLGHSTTLKEKYEAGKYVLKKISYDQHEWDICVDLKMVNFLLGQQSGFTKYPCFLCLHEEGLAFMGGIGALQSKEYHKQPLVDRYRILFPPLHIKLGLIKQITKAIDKHGG